MNNKNIFIIALTGLAMVSASQMASARDQDEQNDHPAYQEHNQHRGDDDRGWNHDNDGGDRLDDQINHLNRMLNHVEREMKRYGANRHIWSEFRQAREQARRLNNRYRNSEQHYDRRRLRAQIQEVRNDLRHIERELHVRANEWYQWR